MASCSGYLILTVRDRFHCLFCHGFEERGAESVGVLAGGMVIAPEAIAHVTPMAKRLSKSVTVYTNGDADLASAVRSKLKSTKIHFDSRVIKRLSLVGSGPSVEVTFEDGTTKTEGFLVNHPKVVQSTPFIEQLGLETTEAGDIKVEAPFNETSVKGCFAAGDATTMFRTVLAAMNNGTFAGGAMVFQLQKELDEKDEL